MLKELTFSSIMILSANAMAEPLKDMSPYADATLEVHSDEKGELAPLDLTKVAKRSGNKSFHLAFITDAGQCEPTWGGLSAYPLNWLKPLHQKATQQGIEMIVAFGGAAGTDISRNCSKSQLIEVLNKTQALYPSKEMDFDIENGTADVPKMMAAIKAFQDAHAVVKISLTLPVMPEGLTWQGQDIVKQALHEGIDFNVNIMAMDYGPAYSGNMGDYAISASENLFKFLKTLYPKLSEDKLWAKIEVTPMIGVNDVNVERFSLEDAKKLYEFASRKKLSRLAMWSVNRDKPCPDKWASNRCSGANLQSRDYQYSEALQGHF